MVALNSPPAYRLSDIFEGEDLEVLLAHNVKTTRSALKIEPHVELPDHIRSALRCLHLPRVGPGLLLALMDNGFANPEKLAKADPIALLETIKKSKRLKRVPHIYIVRALVLDAQKLVGS